MQETLPIRVQLANPRGFCAGVERAINIVNRILTLHGPPVYVKHEIVHNRFVVADFERRGVTFIEDLHAVPVGSILIYSAHGVSAAIVEMAKKRQLKTYDATCPLVTKVHAEVKKLRAADYEVIMIGHAGHPEVEGTLGQVERGVYLIETQSDIEHLTVNNDQRVAYITQTTLSLDDTARLVAGLKKRFPRIVVPSKSDICYATQNRQEAIKKLAKHCEVVLIVGSLTSSNSNRLCEVARNSGVAAYLIDSATDIKKQWLKEKTCVGVSAGASAPESLVEEVVEWLRQNVPKVFVDEVRGTEENIVFSMPKHLVSAG